MSETDKQYKHKIDKLVCHYFKFCLSQVKTTRKTRETEWVATNPRSVMRLRARRITLSFRARVVGLLVLLVLLLLVFSPEIFSTFFATDSQPTVEDITTAARLNVDEEQLMRLLPPSGNATSLLEPSQKMVVPDVVHFIYFQSGELFSFRQMISVLSAHKYINPKTMILHCDSEPTGEYWHELKTKVKEHLQIETIDSRVEVGSKVPISIEHKTSAKAFQILKERGGIYMDFDAIALKSFDPLRYYEFTMGLEQHGEPGSLSDGVILAAPEAPFLQKILEYYSLYFVDDAGDMFCCTVPYYLQFAYPRDIHVEETTLSYPSGPDRYLVYDAVYDWSKNYAIRMWTKTGNKNASQDPPTREPEFFYNEHSIKRLNSTIGEVLRFVYYRSSKLKLK